MEQRKLIPYSVYLPEDQVVKLKELAKQRKAAALIRDAIAMIFGGSDLYNSGYNKGLADAAKVVYDCEEAQMIAIKGKDLGAVLAERIDLLEIK
jgi:predicted transcriptional regulator